MGTVLSGSSCDELELDEDFVNFIEGYLECEPFEVQRCFCTDGSEGLQICSPEGGSWDICICEPPCEKVAEVCDGIDNDCDGAVDEGAQDAPTWYEDNDGDGHGDVNMIWRSCEAPNGYVESSDDCDDLDSDVYPENIEVCDGVDNDCDSNTPDGSGETDTDSDTCQ